jgi:hypothetical protein
MQDVVQQPADDAIDNDATMYWTIRLPVTRVSISLTGEMGWPDIGPPP